MTKVAEQADIEMVPTAAIMRRPSFLRASNSIAHASALTLSGATGNMSEAAIAPCDLPFPQPIRFGREARFWKLAEIEAWEAAVLPLNYARKLLILR
jgi:hypothetical protein